MKVILLEKISKLGSLGNVVNVKDGFARNFLLPQKKALRASESNLAIFEKQRKDLEKANEESRKVAEELGAKMDGKEFILVRQASETGILYGSVSTKDIMEELIAKKHSVIKNQIILNNSIKEIGVYSVQVKLHPEVIVTIKVNVARSEEEAKAATAKPKKAKKEEVKIDASTISAESETTEAPVEEVAEEKEEA